jgi:hypothetical protein
MGFFKIGGGGDMGDASGGGGKEAGGLWSMESRVSAAEADMRQIGTRARQVKARGKARRAKQARKLNR